MGTSRWARRARVGVPITVGTAAAALAALYLRNPSQRWAVRTEVTVAASPDEVWRTLADFASYSRWNPFLVEMEGDAVEGGAIRGVSMLANGRTVRFGSTIRSAVPGRRLAWGGAPSRLLSGHHWLDLEPLDGGVSTLVTHGEDWTGILIPLAKGFGLDERPYVAMNAALRRTCEG